LRFYDFECLGHKRFDGPADLRFEHHNYNCGIHGCGKITDSFLEGETFKGFHGVTDPHRKHQFWVYKPGKRPRDMSYKMIADILMDDHPGKSIDDTASHFCTHSKVIKEDEWTQTRECLGHK